VDTIGPLSHSLDVVTVQYAKLQNIVLRSYRLSAHQRTVKWPDHPGLESNKLTVLMDQLNTLKPTSVDKIHKVLFLHKMPAYIWDIVNPRDFQDLPALTNQCNKISKNRCKDAGAAAAVLLPFLRLFALPPEAACQLKVR
jgi:hypothetical protein